MKKIITVSGQYAGGAWDVGKHLADSLGVPFYDDVGISDKMETLSAETSAVMGARFFSLATGVCDAVGAETCADIPEADRLFLARRDAIRAIASEGPCVIVAEGSEFLLDPADCFCVFVTADLSAREEKEMRTKAVTLRSAVKRLAETDRRRAAYCRFYANGEWGKPEGYALCINGSLFGAEGASEIIKNALKEI